MSIIDKLDELSSARLDFDACVERERACSTQTMAARNRLNNAQKEIDSWYLDQKNEAPWNTEWHGQIVKRSEVR